MRLRIRWLAAFAVCTMLAVEMATRAASSDTVRGSFDRTLKVSGPVDLNMMTGSG